MAQEWFRVVPVPADAESTRPAAHSVRGKPEHEFRFDNDDGLVGYVYRYIGSDGGVRDESLSYWASEAGEYEWRWRVFDEPRPLYGLYKMSWVLHPQGTVIVTDDPECVDALSGYLEGFACVAWLGGVAGVKKTDWKPLAGRQVVIWPSADADHDEDGMLLRAEQPLTRAAKQVSTTLVRLGCDVRLVQLPESGAIENGFCIAKAKAKGWHAADLLGWMSEHVKTVFAKPSKSKKQQTRAKSRAAGGEDDEDEDRPITSMAKLLKRFTLIYGTDTAYDHVEREVIKISHLRLAFGAEWIEGWLGSNKRHTVSRANVVFDPTETADPQTHVNLFFGMPLVPDTSRPCERLLELLHFLCNEDESVCDWVVRWLAYPLQHPGTKMGTSVLMHGDEGSGKNLFLKSIGQIYGPYGSIITQNELESQFTTWASRKLFLVANEVVSRSEIREQKGRLKNLISEDVIQVNEKMLPLREEKNQVNLVFLSNETVPLVLDPSDRRYQVIWTPKPREPAFYKSVSAELEAGGAAGLYAYLLDVDLAGFEAHTKPVVTRAKLDLINMAKSAADLFFDQWKAGLTPLPFGPALAEDLYRGFNKWCQTQGERHAPTQTRFGRAMNRMGVESGVKNVRLPRSGSTKRQRTCYWTAGPPQGEDFIPWLESQIESFHLELEEWVRPGPLMPSG